MKTKLALMSLLFCVGAQAQISGQMFYESHITLSIGYVAGVRDSAHAQGRACTGDATNGDIHKQIIKVIENDKGILQFDAYRIVDGVITKWWPCPKKGQL
jgi:hypothetical protein